MGFAKTLAETLKTGTTTLGVVCKDGILIAADKRATVGHMIYHKDEQKVIPFNDRFVLTIAGSAALANKISKYIKAETHLNKLRLGRQNTVREVVSLASNFLYNSAYSGAGIVHFLLAGANADGSTELYDVFADGSTHHVKDFWATGSGSVFAQGVFESTYSPEMTLEQGTEMIKNAFNSAFKHDSASGNGADIFKVTKNGVTLVETISLKTMLPIK